jgi:hypothetical protein
LKDKKRWDKCLPHAEFSYNNSYQESLKMSPFEVLYGRKCQTPLFLNEPRENQVFGSEILREAKRQVQVVRENLQLVQSRQKSYADHRRRKLSFEVGDFMYLKVSPIQLAQSRQKSYADHRRRKLSFEVSDFMYLKVSPM